LETFKVTVRLVVYAFVIVGSVVTLSGPSQTLVDHDTISVDKPEPQIQQTDYTEARQSIASSESGSSS